MSVKIIQQVPVKGYSYYICDVDLDKNVIKYRISVEPKLLIEENFEINKINNSLQTGTMYYSMKIINKFLKENGKT